MDEGRILERVMFGRRVDSVKEENYQLLQCKNWQVRALDRHDSRSRMKRAQAHHGL